MRPTADLVPDREIGLAFVGKWALIGRPEQQVIDALGVGLDVSGEAAKQRTDRVAVLLRRVLKEHVIGVGDLDEVVATAAGASA